MKRVFTGISLLLILLVGALTAAALLGYVEGTEAVILGMALGMALCLSLTLRALIDGPGRSPSLEGKSGVEAHYAACLSRRQPRCTVLYAAVEQRGPDCPRDRLEQLFLPLCGQGHGRAARVDGCDYILTTDLPASDVEEFCRSLPIGVRKAFPGLACFLGAADGNCGLSFFEAADLARRAAQEAKEAGPDRRNAPSEPDGPEGDRDVLPGGDSPLLLCQPLFLTGSSRVAGCEMLLRPEDCGAAGAAPFDLYLFQSCCRWAAEQASQGLLICCALSESTLAREGIAGQLIQIASQAKVSAGRLLLETGQSCGEDRRRVFQDNLLRLRQAGFRLCAGRFGRGYTALSELALLPPDAVKLDPSLIQASASPAGRALLSGAVQLARALDAAVICGGVESPEQLNAAEAAGCDLAQGPYFCTPLRERALPAFLSGYSPETAGGSGALSPQAGLLLAQASSSDCNSIQ